MNYALEISGFPEVLMEEEVLSDHFESLLKKQKCVAEVSFARNYHKTLIN